MRVFRMLAILGVLTLWASPVWAANSVEVESKTVSGGATGVTIPIRIDNDVAVEALVIPLVIREVTPGAYITSLGMSWGDRLPVPGPLDFIIVTHQYANENGNCKNGQPGGFGTVTYTDGLSHPVTASPEGVLFARVGFSADLTPGSDASGSMILTVDVTSTAGTFEIDTTCTVPASHFDILDASSISISPSFTKGVITIQGGGASTNSVVVESKTVTAGATGVDIPIKITNDVTLQSVVVPLVVREVTAGSYITSMAMSWGDRLPVPGPLDDAVFTTQYATGNGSCKNGQPGGFGTVTYSDGLSHPVAASPEGVQLVRLWIGFSSKLTPGTDATGSMILTVDVTSTAGTFEIDTTCTDPNNHLAFTDISPTTFTPDFTKGVITIQGGGAPTNSVVVESKTVSAGATGVDIPIKITNDITLQSVVVPLVVREVTAGSYITSMAMSWADRLPVPGPLDDAVFTNQYATGNGSCKNGQPGGFGTVTYSDGLSHPVTASPEGIQLVRVWFGFSPTLTPGTDATGSMILTVDVTSTAGTFEIDTTCTDPNNHLAFTDISPTTFTPDFTKGVITIASAASPSSVVVGSQTVNPGATNVDIPIKINNAVTLQALVVPLVIREVTPGAYITAMAMSWGDRLPVPGPMDDAVINNQFTTGNGTCKNGQPGGFGTVTYTDGLSHPVAASPEGALFARIWMGFGTTLAAGSDASGSLILTVDMTSTSGTFEIDTTCTNPANHLAFIEASPTRAEFTPDFTKGVITIDDPPPNLPPIASCQDMTVSADANCEAAVTAAQVDNGSFDPNGDPITLALMPTGPYQLGATPVELIVTDDSGDADTCDATITVEDNTLPIPSCPANISAETDPGEPGVAVLFTANVSDNCPGATIDCTPPSESYFPVGTTPVECIATDASGNADSCTFSVTVTDPCDCPFQSDFDEDGFLTALDLGGMIDILFAGNPDVSDPSCPSPRADFDCDGFSTALDLGGIIDHLFAGGAGPCNPCAK